MNSLTTSTRRRRRESRRLLSGVLTTALATVAFAGALPLLNASGSAAQAASNQPGVPSSAQLLFTEDFENGSGVQSLANYVSAAGGTYTADPYWLSAQNCNGFVLNSENTVPDSSYCNATGSNSLESSARQFNQLRKMTYGLGILGGGQMPEKNRALAANSVGGKVIDSGAEHVAGDVELATLDQLSLPNADGRFITFSVDAAATGCPSGYAAPLLRFYLKDETGKELPVSDTAINPCTDSRAQLAQIPGLSDPNDPNDLVSFGSFASDSSVLLNGSSVGIVLRNEQPTDNGNDGAIDNIRVLDATPQLDKGFSPSTVATGASTRLTFTITNTDELAGKNGWSFTDKLPAGLEISGSPEASTTCDGGNVAANAGESSISVNGNLLAGQPTCEASVMVTSSTAGKYVNGAENVSTVGLLAPTNADVVFQSPALSIKKTAESPKDLNGNGVTDSGDEIPYSFFVTNTGDVSLTEVSVNDEKIAEVSCPAAELSPGESLTCQATYTVLEADVAAGTVVNVATASGLPPIGERITSAPSDTNTPVVSPNPGLSLVKSASLDSFATVGEEVEYAFAVTNTGNIALSELSVNEIAFSGTGNLSDIACPVAELPVGASTECQGQYLVTQADLDAGKLSNTAVAAAVPAGSTAQVVSSEASVEITAAQEAGISLKKSAEVAGDKFVAGAEVAYSFVVTNTGNTTLTDISIDESDFSGFGQLSEVECPAAQMRVMAPGQMICTATYTLTQKDIDAGKVSNTATATGMPPGGAGPITSEPSDITLPFAQESRIEILKTADKKQISKIGESLTFSFVATNMGNVTISDPTIVEENFSGTGSAPELECADVSALLPGQQLTCTASYRVTQADLDSGVLTNTAGALGKNPKGKPVGADKPSTVKIPTLDTAALAITKSADRANVVGAGQTVRYSFEILNTGNVTVLDATVLDTEFTGSGALSPVSCPMESAALAPGATVKCTATYTTTQADVDRGSISNTAVAVATSVLGDDRVESEPSRAEVVVKPGANLAVTGGNVFAPIGAGMVLLVLGFVFLILRKRHRAL